MSLISNLFKRAAKPVTHKQALAILPPSEKVFIEREDGNPVYSYDAPPVLDILDILNGVYSNHNFMELFYSVPELFAPIHEIASRVADATWELCKDWNDEVDYSNETFNKLFSEPNPLEAFKAFVYNSVCYEILTGKVLWSLNKPSTLPQEDFDSIVSWFVLPSPQVTVNQKKTDIYSSTSLQDLVSNYTIPNDYGGVRTFTTDKVISIFHLNLKHGYKDLNRTVSQVQGAEKPLANLIPVYQARKIIYIKRGSLGWIVNRSKDQSGTIPLTEGEREELSKENAATYGITGTKTPYSITGANVDWVQTAMSIKELEPFAETLADACAIYATLRVPPHLIPSKDRSTFNNQDGDMKGFYTGVIIPIAKSYAEKWTNGLNVKPLRRYVRANFNHIEVLQENKKEEADVNKTNGETWKQRWENGVCTLNDWIVSFDGIKGTGAIYEKKIFELTPEEVEQVKNTINLKKVNNGNLEGDTSSKNPGTEKTSGANKL